MNWAGVSVAIGLAFVGIATAPVGLVLVVGVVFWLYRRG